MRGSGCPPAPPRHQWYPGLGISLGNCEARKPQTVRRCGCTGCPVKSDLSHIAEDTAHSWFWGCLTQTTHILAIFGAISRKYLGVGRQQRALHHEELKAQVIAQNVSIPFANLNGFRGRFGPKTPISGTKGVVLRGHLSTWYPRRGAPAVSFWLQNWIEQGAPPPV